MYSIFTFGSIERCVGTQNIVVYNGYLLGFLEDPVSE